jgi:CRAL/TRIO domain
VTDIRLVTLDELWGDGEIPIFDMNNITLKHFTKIVFSTMRLFLRYSQEAHPVTVRQVHIVNCNSLVNRIMMIIKPFLKVEVANRIHTHLPGSETLFMFIPRSILPKEYGGMLGSIEAMQNYWLGFLENYR